MNCFAVVIWCSDAISQMESDSVLDSYEEQEFWID